MASTPNRPELALAGDWEVRVSAGQASCAGRTVTVDAPATLAIAPAVEVAVTAEHWPSLPLFAPAAAGWAKGRVLQGINTQETSAKGMLDPSSLRLTSAPGGEPYQLGQDYDADLEWGTFGRLPGGRIGEDQSVYAYYRYGASRLDAVVADAAGRLVVRPGMPHVAVPRAPVLARGEAAIGHVWVPGRLDRLGPDALFPILETEFPEPDPETPSLAERWLPRTVHRLRRGEHLRLLAWGDSVTEAGYLAWPEAERWQAQLVARLRARFPRADLELVTEAWPGYNTASYLAEPPGSLHNYREKVLGAHPDLVVSEFVNDAGLPQAQVEQQYEQLRADFAGIGAEWLILTPHYVRPDWMELTRERDVDEDPRPYVHFLRRFAGRPGVALADAARRWGRLWRQGIPYTTLLLNAINHPDERGMRLFADSAMALFPPPAGA